MIKFLLEKFILSWLPSAVIEYFVELYNENKNFREIIWYISKTLKVSGVLIPLTVILLIFYIRFPEVEDPVFNWLDNYIWNNDFVDYIGNSQATVARAIYAVIFGTVITFFMICGIVAFIYKPRRQLLIEYTAQSMKEELEEELADMYRIIKVMMGMFRGIVCVIDRDFVISEVNDKYYLYSEEHDIGLEKSPPGHTFCFVFFFLDVKHIRKKIAEKFDTRDKESFVTEGRIGNCKRCYEIVMLPTGNGHISKMIIFINDLNEIIGDGECSITTPTAQ